MNSSMQKITPDLWFDDQAIEAARFYVSAFGNGSTIKDVTTLHDTPSGDCDVVSFELSGQSFMAIGAGPLFKFNPSVSFLVVSKTKKEVDDLWGKLSAVPEAEQCGWLKDKYGVSWQVVPRAMDEMMSKGTPEQIARVTQAFLKMKKFDIQKLQEAHEGH